jgi:hypothetical protein
MYLIDRAAIPFWRKVTVSFFQAEPSENIFQYQPSQVFMAHWPNKAI